MSFIETILTKLAFWILEKYDYQYAAGKFDHDVVITVEHTNIGPIILPDDFKVTTMRHNPGENNNEC